jgi:20S proteasome alpha/beta subunit
MTCIIGARCMDGVVLIGDRKIINHDNSFDFRDKLFMVYNTYQIGYDNRLNQTSIIFSILSPIDR